MKPFALETVLRYRGQVEDAARQKLHQAMAEEVRLGEAVAKIQADLDDLYAHLCREQESGITADRLALFTYRLAIVREDNERLALTLEKQRQLVAQKRQLLIKASKDRKIMEKLKEQQNAAYRQYLDKKETGMLDEFAVLFHERK
jgi:flagellar FliJ protein